MRLTIQNFTFPLAASNARATWTQREGFFLSLTDENGQTGRGEVCPLPNYSRETLAECLSHIQKLKVKLQQKTVVDLCWQQAETIGTEFPAALRCGFECAYVQALSCIRQETIRETLRFLLREMGAEVGQAGAIPLAFLLRGSSRDDWAADFSNAWENGFRTFKIKIGRQEKKEQEQQGIVWLRRNMGREGRLRVDSNGVFTSQQAEEWACFLREQDVEFWEEPGAVPACPCPPLAQDESLLSVPPARSSSVLVLKPMLLGLFASMRLIASHQDKQIVISHLFESATGWNHIAALALALGKTDPAAGLAPHAGLDKKDLLWFKGNHLEPVEKNK